MGAKVEEEFTLIISFGGHRFSHHNQERESTRHPKGAIPNTIVSSWVRKGNLYSLKGKPIDGYKDILDHESMPVVEEK